MSIFKCKMCGGTLNVQQGQTVCECEYCGTKQTVSATNDEVVANLYNRANNLRIKCEFDKAQETYEKIVSASTNDAEAYWGLVLCKYGIEYVDDPATSKKIPTCHRTQLESVLSDVDYISAVNNADDEQKIIYEQEAMAIDKLQKDILEIVNNEKPFDVFICYKETDENGNRTVDSTLANDIYYQLTQEGLKVFFAAITLEDKLGQEYEPYIFAALNSAKVMLVVGTKPEHFDAVWVKNEWSRFLKLMKSNREKKLIPCYRDMDAYNLPIEFSHLQAQDMSKIGFVNDIVRGIKKIVKGDAEQEKTIDINTAGGVNINALLKRVFLFLEDGKWQEADEYCEKVLDVNAECDDAYLGKLMAKYKVRKKEDFVNLKNAFNNDDDYNKILRFGSEELKAELKKYNEEIISRNKENAYLGAINTFNNAASAKDCYSAADVFKSLDGYKDSKSYLEQALNRADECRKDVIYDKAKALMVGDNTANYETAINDFTSISDWKDATAQIDICRQRIDEINEANRLALESAKKRETKKKILRIAKKASVFVIIGIVILSVVINKKVIVPNREYKEAIQIVESGDTIKGYEALIALDGYKDSAEKGQAIFDDYCKEKRNVVAKSQTIAAGANHVAVIKTNGTVKAFGDNEAKQCEVSKWKKVISISARSNNTVGLRSNGTVVVAGDGTYGQRKVSSWKGIVAVAAGGYHTVGLKKDGTVVAAGAVDKEGEVKVNYNQCEVSEWTDIVAIAAGQSHTVGLTAYGTVVAVGSDSKGQCSVRGWTHVIAIAAGDDFTIALTSDGKVYTTKKYDSLDESKKHKISGFKDAVAISAGTEQKYAIMSDGTVVDKDAYRNDKWTDIVAVCGNYNSTVALKSDGTLVYAGTEENIEKAVGKIKGVRVPIGTAEKKAQAAENNATNEKTVDKKK